MVTQKGQPGAVSTGGKWPEPPIWPDVLRAASMYLMPTIDLGRWFLKSIPTMPGRLGT